MGERGRREEVRDNVRKTLVVKDMSRRWLKRKGWMERGGGVLGGNGRGGGVLVSSG